jgi:UDP-N-acetylmuramoyl-L-alanyl-D-glutamate--2,6-diaminopimelate ligase
VSPDTSHLLRPATVGTTPWEQLEEVLGHPRIHGELPGRGVRGITLDSRQVSAGDLYVGLPGTRFHGASFAAAAVAAGACAVLTDPRGEALIDDQGVPVLVVADPRVAMARASALIFGEPTRRMTMYGITGTNGKTTTAFLVEAGLRAAGLRAGTIGTIGYRLDGRPLPSARTTITTPEAPDLQALFATMADAGATDTVMEVSSHALAMHRVDGTRFDVAAFTNLGRDHLDYHKTMEAYFQAKARLFTPELTRAAVVNVDDEYGRRLAEIIRAEDGVELITTSVDAASDYRVASWQARGGLGSIVQVETPSGLRELPLSLPGEFNVRNAVMALAMLKRAGHGFDDVAPGLAQAQVPGRMERVDIGTGAPEVLVDFAHTPQAIGSALAAARTATAGRLIAVLGAGGDRDSAKRGPMGGVAAEHADVVVVTDDNPRTEDPQTIRAAVLAGARERGGAEVVDGGDRRTAIREALAMAGDTDLVAVLGKGHETGQLVGDRVLEFDDRVVTGQEWARLHGSPGPAQAQDGEDITA